MEDVLTDISSIVSLDQGTLTKLMDKFVELGVTGMADLVDVQLEDLTPGILLPIPARKIIRVWSERKRCLTATDNQAILQQIANTQTFGSSATTSTSTTSTPSSATAHKSSTSSTPTTPIEMNWETKFNFDTVITSMLHPSQPLLTQQAAKCLRDGRQLTNAARNEIIRCTVSEILKFCCAPTRNNGLNAAAEAMVNKYQQLKDVINETIVGPGWISVRNQLEYRLSYVKRPVNSQRRITAARRRLPVEENENNLSKKKFRDGYGCVDFLPATVQEGECEESLGVKQKTLKDMYANQNWNEGEITDLMRITYVVQRQDLVGPSALPFIDVIAEWPFLTEPKWMFQHLERLLGCDIQIQLLTSLQSKKQNFLDFFAAKSRTHQCLRQRLDELGEDPPPAVLITLLMRYFKEDENTILHSYEVTIFTSFKAFTGLDVLVSYCYLMGSK
jgi:hypothetical protein